MIRMTSVLREAIISRFQADYHAKPQGGGARYKEGVCPSCGKKKLWIFGDNPWQARCDSASCGYEENIKELMPDLFQSYSERFKTELQTDPKAAAKAYLQETRGFNVPLIGEFTQETFALNGISSATVRFKMPNNGYWERLIDDADRFGDLKAVFQKGYSYKGLAWEPPNFDVNKIKALWIVEGIFDALALAHHGIVAISAMSANNLPINTLKRLYPYNPKLKIVVALDTDKNGAGQKATLKWIPEIKKIGYENVVAAITNSDEDWNDWHLKKWLDEKNIKEAFFQGALLTANSASKKAQLIWNKTAKGKFYFEFNYKTYWFEFDFKKYNEQYNYEVKNYCEQNKIEESDFDEEQIEYLQERAFVRSNTIIEIANCVVNVLYSQIERDTEDRYYYLSILQRRKGAKGAFTPKQISSAGEFKNKIMGVLSGAIYTGETKQLDQIYLDKTANIKDIETIPYIGYYDEAAAYIYQGFAVKNGRIYEPNSEDYYEIGKINIKSTFEIRSFAPSLEYKNEWTRDFIQVFGKKGLVALAFWLGSLFAQQIRKEYQAYPFLEVTGDAGAGKSTLLEFLWKLIGRSDHEGTNPTTSSQVGVLRTMAQVSNMPVVLLEGDTDENDRSKQKKINFEIFKSAFNGRVIRSKGVKNNGNQTDEEPFKAALVISQNAKIQGSEAILSRLIYLHFDRSEHCVESREAAMRLNRMGINDVSGFLIHTLKHESQILKAIDSRFVQYRDAIMALKEVRTGRIGLTHGLILALLDALSALIHIPASIKQHTQEYIKEIAIEREADLTADHPFIEQFWAVFEFLEGQKEMVNHSRNDHTIAINMEQFYALAFERRHSLEDIKQVKKMIKKSVRHEYLDNKPVNSKFENQTTRESIFGTIRCFVFRRKKHD